MSSTERAMPSGPFARLRQIDDAIFAVEQSIVAFALVTITAVIFIDVVARRINAPDSKVGDLLAKIAGIDDLETRAWIGNTIAPWVTLGLALLLIGFAVYSARRFARARDEDAKAPELGRELGVAAGTAVITAGLGWAFGMVFGSLDSWMVYSGLFALCGVGLAAYEARRRRERWPLRAGAAVVGGLLLAWLSSRYIPEGYTWSKRVSLMLVLWMGMLSASICVYAGKHIRIEAASKLVPENAKRWVTVLSGLGAAGFCGLMAYLGFRYVFAFQASDDEYMQEAFRLFDTRYVYGFEGMIGRGGMLEGTDIPDWIGIISAPIGMGMASLRFVGVAVSALLGGTYGKPAEEEGLEEARKAATGEAKSDSVSDSESDSESESESESESKSVSDSDSDSDSESESESDSESAPKPSRRKRSAGKGKGRGRGKGGKR
ncbi:MAG: TRAP transporter small permease [Sandaracinaceae bacterium]